MTHPMCLSCQSADPNPYSEVKQPETPWFHLTICVKYQRNREAQCRLEEDLYTIEQ